MIVITIFVLVFLGATHYIAYTYGEEASDKKWVVRMRQLQNRFDDFMKSVQENERRTVVVKSKTPKAKKVKINRK